MEAFARATLQSGVARIRIGDLLVKAGLISELQLQSALAHQRRWGGKLGDALIQCGFLDEMMLWKGLSKQLGVQLLSIPALTLAPGIERELPAELAFKHKLIPIEQKDRSLTVATSEPNNVGGLDEVAFRLGVRLKVVLAPEREVDWALRRLYQGDPAPCPPPTVRPARGPPQPSPMLGLPDAGTPMHQLAQLAAHGTSAAVDRSSNPASATAGIVAQGAEVLRLLVDTCVRQGIFTRAEYDARLLEVSRRG